MQLPGLSVGGHCSQGQPMRNEEFVFYLCVSKCVLIGMILVTHRQLQSREANGHTYFAYENFQQTTTLSKATCNLAHLVHKSLLAKQGEPDYVGSKTKIKLNQFIGGGM